MEAILFLVGALVFMYLDNQAYWKWVQKHGYEDTRPWHVLPGSGLYLKWRDD